MPISTELRTKSFTMACDRWKNISTKRAPVIQRVPTLYRRKISREPATKPIDLWMDGINQGKFHITRSGNYVVARPVGSYFKYYLQITRNGELKRYVWNNYITLQMAKALYYLLSVGGSGVANLFLPDLPPKPDYQTSNFIAVSDEDKTFNFPVTLMNVTAGQYKFDIQGTDYFLWNDGNGWYISPELNEKPYGWTWYRLEATPQGEFTGYGIPGKFLIH